MQVSGLDHINYRVADADRSLRFYPDVGFRQPERLASSSVRRRRC